MNLEGRIDIRLARGAVHLRSTRPQLAQQLFAERTPGQVAHLAGLMFSLCGKAQRIAAEAACEAAAGQRPDAATQRAREIAVLQELAQEHAWRLLIDWPKQAGATSGLAPDLASVQRLRQAAGDPQRFAATLDELLQTVLLGEPVATWLARDLAGFDAWRQAATTPTARLYAGLGHIDLGISDTELLPTLKALDEDSARALARNTLETPAFCGLPLWRDAPAETGALVRLYKQAPLADWIARRGRGAGARLLARLLELVSVPTHLAELGRAGIPAGELVHAWALADNIGLAGVETSRGLLLHVVRLQDGKVDQYRIVAPTEWNFHPAGPLVRALGGLTAGEGLERQARLVAQSLDPCVEYGIEVSDA
jgi:hypothetical protein